MADRATVIRRMSMADQAETLIIEMVRDGSLRAGERINEVELAEALGISRGPLREAIKRLSGQGYLTMQTHRGAFVRFYSPKDIQDLYELRTALELHAVKLAIQRASAGEFEELEADLMCLASSEGGPRVGSVPKASGPYVQELGFHEQLAVLSENEQIREQLQEANHKLYIALAPTMRSGMRTQHTAQQHLEIVGSLRARDAERATALLESHLKDSMLNSLEVLGLKEETETNDKRKGC